MSNRKGFVMLDCGVQVMGESITPMGHACRTNPAFVDVAKISCVVAAPDWACVIGSSEGVPHSIARVERDWLLIEMHIDELFVRIEEARS